MLKKRLEKLEKSLARARVVYRVVFANADGTYADAATGELVARLDGERVIRLRWPDAQEHRAFVLDTQKRAW